jgi:hypothetical protein
MCYIYIYILIQAKRTDEVITLNGLCFIIFYVERVKPLALKLLKST